jgi:hypothetical protein
MTAPLGAIVGLYVDLVASVATGDLIETQTGRCYFVVDVRVQKRGRHQGRQHLRAQVIDRADVCPSAMVGRTVHTIRWYKRDAKRKR